MRIAYFDCFSGISGDMTIAAFLDAGLDINILAGRLKGLGVKGYALRKTKARRGELTGTKFDCIADTRHHAHRSLKEIIRIIDKSSLNTRVKEMAKDIFLRIGKAEAKIHGFRSTSDVHLHELGDIDSIIDIVAAAVAVDELAIDEVHASPVCVGRAVIATKGGILPAPAPAALELLKGVPVRMSDIESELVTPTGAGILKSLVKAFGGMPPMKISAIGYGAGTKDFRGLPNMLRIIIGDRTDPFKEDRIVVVETNIDDMNPQGFEYLFERLFKEGALDVYASVIHMKKSRPGFKLTVLAEPTCLDRISRVIFSETPSIGVRYSEVGRLKLERKIVTVKTRFGVVRVKISTGAGGIRTVSPEYDDCIKVARVKKTPYRIIYEAAKNAVGT